MKKIILIIFWLTPFSVLAQNNLSISFCKEKKWEDILRKAQIEHKNIFIDAYATWCVPCKKMDLEVYTDSLVSKYVNSNFIAIKVQFDQTKNDSEDIKGWYKDAKYLLDFYRIDGFPTFLFVSPDGELIDKASGYQNPEIFLSTIKHANDPLKNYASQINQFKSGTLNNDLLINIALMAKRNNDPIATQIAKKYKENVIEKDSPAKLINKDLYEFIINFQDLFRLQDQIVKYLYHNQKESDRLLNQRGFSRRFIKYLVGQEIVKPTLQKNEKYVVHEPSWKALQLKIETNYDTTIANGLILDAKIEWFTAKRNWPLVIKYTIEHIEINKVDTVGIAKAMLNNTVYNIIFLHSDDSKALQKGLFYINLILENNPNRDTWLDTKANLLYKLNRKDEAKEIEERALKIASNKNDKYREKQYQATLQKMINNEPTWLDKEN